MTFNYERMHLKSLFVLCALPISGSLTMIRVTNMMEIVAAIEFNPKF